jgi:hypothetical protein
MNPAEEIKKLEQSFAEIHAKMIETKAYSECSPEDQYKSLCNCLANLSERISYVSQSFYNYTYEHSKGHSLPLKTATHVQNYLDACGMGDDYRVEKPVIYASASRRGLEVNAEFVKKHEKA